MNERTTKTVLQTAIDVGIHLVRVPESEVYYLEEANTWVCNIKAKANEHDYTPKITFFGSRYQIEGMIERLQNALMAATADEQLEDFEKCECGGKVVRGECVECYKVVKTLPVKKVQVQNG